MTTLKTKNIQEIFILKYFSNLHDGSVSHITSTVEDAYDLAVDFLKDKFDHTKEMVVEILTKERKTDYVEILPVGKVDYWNDIHKKDHSELGQCQYYFRIVRTNIEKVVR